MKDQHIRTLILILLCAFNSGMAVNCAPNKQRRKEATEDTGVNKQFRDRMETMAKKLNGIDSVCLSGIGLKASKTNVKTWIDTISKIKIEGTDKSLGEFEGNKDAHVKAIASSRTIQIRTSFMKELFTKTKAEEKKALDLDILQAFLMVHSEDDKEHKISNELYKLVQKDAVASCMAESKFVISEDIGKSESNEKIHFTCGAHDQLEVLIAKGQDGKLMAHAVVSEGGDNKLDFNEVTCTRPFMKDGFQAGSKDAKENLFTCTDKENKLKLEMHIDPSKTNTSVFRTVALKLTNDEALGKKSEIKDSTKACKMSIEFYQKMEDL